MRHVNDPTNDDLCKSCRCSEDCIEHLKTGTILYDPKRKNCVMTKPEDEYIYKGEKK